LANYVLGNVSDEQLIDVATDALVEGWDSSALRMLAAESKTDYSYERIKSLLNRSLEELNVTLPQKEDAIWTVLCFYIKSIAESSISARDGMSLIIDNVYYQCDLQNRVVKYVGDSHDIQALIGNYYSHNDLDERPDEVSFDGKYGKAAHDALDEHIVDLAKTWVTKHCK